MPKRILVTGINGFVGKHLARELFGRGCEVVGIGHDPRLDPSLLDIVSAYYTCDLTDEAAVSRLQLSNINAVISLAGLANVGASFGQPELYYKVNVGVLSVLGNRLLDIKSNARVIAISTGAVYDSSQPMPLTETSKLITTGSPYALSKIAMEQAAGNLRGQGLDCIVARPFNHIGPGQAGGFLIPDLYQKILQAKDGNHTVKVGDLSTRRDYTDVRDVVRAYADLALARDIQDDVYNVCTGRSVDGHEILQLLLKESGLESKITIEHDPGLIRPDDPKDLFGSNERLQTQTGWQPTIPLQQTIQDFVSDFRT